MTSPAPTQQPPRISVQAFWLTFSKVVGALINIALPMFLVRVMNQTEYGQYKQVFVFSATAVSLSTLGVGISAFYFLPRYPERAVQVINNIVLYHIAVGSIPLLVLVAYPQVLGDVFGAPGLQPYAPLLGLLILFTLIATSAQQVPTALQDVRNSTIVTIGTQLSKAIVLGVVAIFSPTVLGLLAAGVVHQVLQSSALSLYVRKRFGTVWANFEKAFFWEQISYAIPLGVFGMLTVIKRDIHNYFVTAAFSAADFAIYAVGCLQTPLASVLLESVATVLVVRVSAMQMEGRHRDVLKLIATAVNRLAVVQFAVAGILFVTGRDLIVLLYTAAYEQSATIYAVNVWFLVLPVMIVDPVARAYTEIRRFVLIARIATLAGLVVCLYFAIQQIGMVGAIAASLLSAVVERLLIAWRAWRAVGATRHDLQLFKEVPKAAALTVAAIVAASAGRDLLDSNLVMARLVVAMLVFGAVYVPAMYFLRLPGWEHLQKDSLRKRLKQVKAKVPGLRG